MSDPVDLSNLRTMIDHNSALEKELTDEFFSTADLCLQQLVKNMDSEHAAMWHQQAHLLKGLAYNFGAQTFGDLAKTAQEQESATFDVKQTLLAALEKEYSNIKVFLQHKTSA